MRRFRTLHTILVLAILSLAVSACFPVQRLPVGAQSWPPLFVRVALAPVTAGQTALRTSGAAAQPTVAPTATNAPTVAPTVAPTATTAPTAVPPAPTTVAVVAATATPAATATSAPTATTVPPAATTAPGATPVPPTATTAALTSPPAAAAAAPAGPKSVVITEADLKNAIGSGALAANGVDVQNLQIRITGGKLYLTADALNYGLVRLNNLNVVGRLYAQDGALQIQIESISPGGFATAMLPNMANQALRQYGSQYYIDQVNTTEGQIELVIR